MSNNEECFQQRLSVLFPSPGERGARALHLCHAARRLSRRPGPKLGAAFQFDTEEDANVANVGGLCR